MITKHLSGRNLFLLAIFWTVLITIASLVSLNNAPKIYIPGKDKTAHFVFYFLFVLFWFLALKHKFRVKYFNLLLVIFAILYGVCMEIMQSVFTNNRQADFYDVLANSFGAIFGIVFVNLFFKFKRNI